MTRPSYNFRIKGQFIKPSMYLIISNANILSRIPISAYSALYDSVCVAG